MWYQWCQVQVLDLDLDFVRISTLWTDYSLKGPEWKPSNANSAISWKIFCNNKTGSHIPLFKLIQNSYLIPYSIQYLILLNFYPTDSKYYDYPKKSSLHINFHCELLNIIQHDCRFWKNYCNGRNLLLWNDPSSKWLLDVKSPVILWGKKPSLSPCKNHKYMLVTEIYCNIVTILQET